METQRRVTTHANFNSHKKRGETTQTPPLAVTRAFHNELSQVFNLKTNEKRQSIIHKQ